MDKSTEGRVETRLRLAIKLQTVMTAWGGGRKAGQGGFDRALLYLVSFA